MAADVEAFSASKGSFLSIDGKLYQRSAVCAHLGCIVRFNSLEKTWDCPCHGSRYGIDGHPINTPAFKPLEEIKEESVSEDQL